jgi:hypothetical protein
MYDNIQLSRQSVCRINTTVNYAKKKVEEKLPIALPLPPNSIIARTDYWRMILKDRDSPVFESIRRNQ